jgi:hypothetical protein
VEDAAPPLQRDAPRPLVGELVPADPAHAGERLRGVVRVDRAVGGLGVSDRAGIRLDAERAGHAAELVPRHDHARQVRLRDPLLLPGFGAAVSKAAAGEKESPG